MQLKLKKHKTMQEEIILNKARIREIYNNSSREEKKFLEKIFGTEHFDFDYREIKSFEDACKHLGISTYVPANREGFDIDEQAAMQSEAMYKLMVICKALCNGKYTDEDGDSWFPYYWLYSNQELESMGEEQRKAKGIQFLSACYATIAEYAGVCCENEVCRGAITGADFGFPLCANSKEMAEYLDEQFRDLIFQCYGLEVKKEN